MKRSGEWVTLSPAASLCTEKAFRKFVWPSGDDISPEMRFLIRFHFKVSDFSASLLIGILLAVSSRRGFRLLLHLQSAHVMLSK